MATIMRQHEMSPAGVFNNDDVPPRSFMEDVIAVITQPSVFFVQLRRVSASYRTLLIAIVILGIIGFNALQMTTTTGETQSVDVVDVPLDGMPFDPGFVPDGGGAPTNDKEDPSAKWMTALTAIGTQVAIWFVLTLLLSEVTMFNGRKPVLSKNLQIVVWSSVPLALMAILQAIFITGGGTINAIGFSGLLDEWPRFAEMNLYLQSFVHALASQLTLFWVWSLFLLYIGARLTLRGKRFAVITVIALWIVMVGVAYSVQSYDTLSENTPITDDMPHDGMPIEGDMLPDESGMIPDDSDLMPETDGGMSDADEVLESVVEKP